MTKEKTELQKTLAEIEQKTGAFSKYKTTKGPGQEIQFADKPAQQFLKSLGVESNPAKKLSSKAQQKPLEDSDFTDVTVKGLGTSDGLTLSKKRIDQLYKSAKVYINTTIITQDIYHKAIENKTVKSQDSTVCPANNIHWQNLAVGICHAQEIDLLVDQVIDQNGMALAGAKTGEIKEDAPALLLLSSPALNFAYGTAKKLTEDQQEKFIKGMYRNLFAAAGKEGRQFIALPAAGLGVFGGNSQLYFKILMDVAKEFPELNIIYHPAQFGEEFNHAWVKADKPANVAQATKDVVFIADELTKAGKPCALHNPSDADVVYGVYDVGEYWKNGKGSGYVGEEHIGAMTTAPLNSKGLNPKAYQNIVALKFAFMIDDDARQQFLDELIKLADLQQKYEDSGDKKRAAAARNLYGALDEAANNYFKNPAPETYSQFKQNCENKITEARKGLDTVDGKQILKNIGLAILGLGVLYAVAIVINKSINGRFLFFPSSSTTESLKQLDELQEKSNTIQPK